MKTLAGIVAAGAVSPVGLTAAQTAFSHRASAAGMREAPLIDRDGQPITMCFLPNLDPRLTGADRAFVLGRRALEEAARALGPAAEGLSARLYLCADEHLAADRGAEGIGDAPALAQSLARGVSTLLPDLTVEALARGPATAAYVIPAIADALGSGAVEAAILGGVHTDYDPRRVAALSAADRLFRPDNLDSFIPGECAAFVVLMRPDVARRRRLPLRGEIRAVATGHERARPDNDASSFQATGLTAALRTVLGPLGQEGVRVGWVLTDLTFEVWRHNEVQAATVRTHKHYCEPMAMESPGQRLGHLGAAAMPMHLVLAAEGFRRGFAPHPVALSIAGSDAGERGALVVTAPEG